MKRDEIIQELKKVNSRLNEIYIDINNENTIGKQFDFVSHPRLADAVDMLRKMSQSIDKIVYQEE